MFAAERAQGAEPAIESGTAIAPYGPKFPSTFFLHLSDCLGHLTRAGLLRHFLMFLAQIWRYPVKSMKGESLDHAQVGMDGIEGDRIVQVRNSSGRIISARTRPRLLGHQATLGPDGVPRVDGLPWTAPEVQREVEAAAGPGSHLTLDYGTERFDVRPLLVATDGAIAALGEDGRRLRPNLVIGGVTGLTERAWEGRFLRIGSVVIEVIDLRSRCIMTTFHPETLEQDTGVLRRIQKEFGGVMALNCSVLVAGQVAEGDAVTVVEQWLPRAAGH
jgi:hypothetical protein